MEKKNGTLVSEFISSSCSLFMVKFHPSVFVCLIVFRFVFFVLPNLGHGQPWFKTLKFLLILYLTWHIIKESMEYLLNIPLNLPEILHQWIIQSSAITNSFYSHTLMCLFNPSNLLYKIEWHEFEKPYISVTKKQSIFSWEVCSRPCPEFIYHYFLDWIW